ncbi:MAG: serine hydrolase domain-containing protein [Pseudomonadales bacterium]|nr:serine hydrolase domain-containing protein [Pseudomonadales bacterium]
MILEGETHPAFRPLQQRLERAFRRGAETNAQLCVYVDGECVVDLWGSASGEGDASFGPDSLVNIFSSGKSLEAIALASLVSRGRLDYETPVVAYWPEFGAEGKESVRVCDLMRHEAGLAAFDRSIAPEDLLPENIRLNRVGRIIEGQAQRFRSNGEVREYHAVTRGWIANELFRRVDPAGRTIGEFLREEIAGPLQADVHIGVQEEDLARVASVKPLPQGRYLLELLKPPMAERAIEHDAFSLAANVLPLLGGFKHRSTADAPPPIEGMTDVRIFNDPVVRRGETPSANAHGSARGLARLAAAMASEGALGEHRLMSRAAWRALHAEPVRRPMGMETTFTQGGVAHFGPHSRDPQRIVRALNLGRDGFYGWMGLGGSIFQWHPERRIGFAFVPTSLHVPDFVNERGKAYQALAVDCLARAGAA